MFARIGKLVRKLNSNYDVLKSLKQDSFVETFNNISSYRKLKGVKRDIRKIKGTKKKNPEGYKIKQSLFEQVKKAENLPIEERDIERAYIRKKANLEALKQQRAKGKKICGLKIKCLKSETFNNRYSLVKKAGFLAGLACLTNKDNIETASEQGIIAALEEADKASMLAILGLGLVEPLKRQGRNLATTVSLHVPKYGLAVNTVGVIGVALTIAFGIKAILKNIWQTEHEKH